MFDNTVPGSGTIVDIAALDPRTLLIALNQASYDWCLETDRLAWSAGAARVLRVEDDAALTSGKAFARLIDFDVPGGRHEVMAHRARAGTAEGGAYCLRYAYQAGRNGPRRWIEDRGRCFSGPDGRPVTARGLLRVVAECMEEETVVAARGGGHIVGRCLASAAETLRPVGLFLVSIHRLDRIHAEFGAVVADLVAAQVMRALRSVLRVGDSLASIADGRFAVVLSGCRATEMPDAAERFHRAVTGLAVEAEAGRIHPRVSIGCVSVAPAAMDAGSALHAAQRALDRCEREQPGGRVIFTDGTEDMAVAGSTRALAAALDEDRLFLAFEPVMNIPNRQRDLFRARPCIRGADAGNGWNLVRMTPACDRPLARRLASRLMDLAAAALARHPGVELALSLPVPIVPPRGAAKTFSRLTIELDETVAKSDLAGNGRYCRAIKAAGAALDVTGFGGGHLSFAGLKALGADRVTVLGALVDTAGQVAQGRFALRSLVEAATAHGLRAGAEWVDDEAAAPLLAGWGCDRLSGAVAGPLRLELPRPLSAGREPMALTGS